MRRARFRSHYVSVPVPCHPPFAGGAGAGASSGGRDFGRGQRGSFSLHNRTPRPSRNPRRPHHSLCGEPRRIRRDNYLRLEHSGRDPHFAPRDLQRAPAARWRGRSGSAFRHLNRARARRRGVCRLCGAAPFAGTPRMTSDVALRHRFGDFSLDASFRIGKGVTALYGPSGSGKTTIVNALAGLLRPDHGRIVVDGETLLDTDTGAFVSARRRRTGYVFQDARLFPHYSVRQNLLFGARRATKCTFSPRLDDVVELLGLQSLLGRKPGKLSGGEKSRVALGRALLSGPRVLLLDEPLAALDAKRKSEIIPYLERLRDSVRPPMIYVTHSVEEVSRLAEDLIVLHNGKIVASGSVFDLLCDPLLGPLVPTHGAVFPATVHEHRADGLTALAFDGGVILVPHLPRPLH